MFANSQIRGQDDDPAEVIPEEIVRESYELRLKGHSSLNLYLRFPSQGKENVQGVLAICKYGDRNLEMDLTGGSRHFGYLLEFADENRLAVVAFGQPSRKGWNKTVSSDQLSSREAASQDRNLDGLAREWSRTMERFARKYKLPEENWLMYGLCGGAQYAHRIALRQPDKFKAVHVHYGGSYDIPTEGGKKVFWLVTSRADEPAFIAAQRFYQQCRAFDYRMILKGFSPKSAPDVYNNTGDYTGEQNSLQTLSMAFFDYALHNDDWDMDSEEAYIADYINGAVFAAHEGGWIPKKQAINLPSKELAQAWGKLNE